MLSKCKYYILYKELKSSDFSIHRVSWSGSPWGPEVQLYSSFPTFTLENSSQLGNNVFKTLEQ